MDGKINLVSEGIGRGLTWVEEVIVVVKVSVVKRQGQVTIVGGG